MDDDNSVIVVGAGIVGVCAALALQARGLRVKIIDSLPAGQACSFGNAGVITPSAFPLAASAPLSALPGLFLKRSSPATLHWPSAAALLPWSLHYARGTAPARVARGTRTLHRLAGGALAAYRTLLGGELPYVEQRGWLLLHQTQEELARAAPMNAQRAELGVALRTVSTDELGAMEPALRGIGAGATLIADAAHVRNPSRFVGAAFDVFMQRGGSHEADRIVRIERGPDHGVRLVGSRATHMAARAVLATGAATNALLRCVGHHIPLIAERGYHVMLDDASPVVTRPVALSSLGVVLSPTDAGTRLVGLSHFGRPGFAARPALMQAAVRRLQAAVRRLQAVVPAGVRSGAQVWSGERPATPDSLPIVEQVPGVPSLYVTTGHGHTGLTLAAVTGLLLADQVSGVPAACGVDVSSSRFASGPS